MRLQRWFHRQIQDRDKIDKMVKTHDEIKEERRNTPAGFEATEIERHRRSSGIG